MKKKKKVAVIGGVLVVAAAIAGGAWFFLGNGLGNSSGKDKVYVEQVASLMNLNAGTQNRYTGVVEPQESSEIKKDAEKTIKEVLVKEGDAVEVGTALFEYDTVEIQDQIDTAELELEGFDNEISDYYGQIEALKAERDTVSEDEKFQYTTQIQSIEMSVKQAQYNKKSKQSEIEKLKESMGNSVVKSEIAGVIKSINENGYDQYTGEELPFMTVLATGDYRVKGTINEQNIWMLEEGSPVLIRSRIDETQTWTGKIKEVDTNSQTSNENEMYEMESGMETATKYPFYVTLDNTEGLILGQHIFIELDMGQAQPKEGVWLYEGYVVTEESRTFVWADNGNKRIEKRAVELGEYDEALGMYQILSGLTAEDYITYPMASLYEGVVTVTNEEEVDYDSPMYQEEGMMDEEMLDEEMLDEDMLDEDMLDEEMLDEGMLDEEMLEEDMPEDEMSEDEMSDEEMSDEDVLEEDASDAESEEDE